MAGDMLISPRLTTRLLKQFSAGDVPVAAAEPLTPREAEVARLVADGRTNGDIADQLFLAAGTVKNHLAVIQRKLGVANRVGIASWVVRNRPPGA